jgi:hypothetical protein
MSNFDQIKPLQDKIVNLLLDIKDIKPNLYREYTLIVDYSINGFINLGAEYIKNNPQEFEIFLKKLNDIIKILTFIKTKENIQEEKQKRDRCLRIADRKFDKPSAYKSGAVVRCRKGDIWKDIKEADNPQSGKAAPYGSGYSKLKDIIREIIQEESINQKIDKLPQGKIFDDAKNIKDIFKRSSYSWSEVIELFEKNKHKSKPEIIDIKDIHITQPNIQANKVKNMLDKVNTLSPINIVEFEDGKKVIYDGHHRLVANWALGNNRIKVNLVKVNNLTEDESLHKWFKRKGEPGKKGGWVDCNAPIRKDGKITGYKACGREKGEKRAKYPSCRPTAAKCKTPGKGTKWGKTK